MTSDEQRNRLADVGRELLAERLDILASEIAMEMRTASQRVRHADELTAADAERLRDVFSRAEMVLDYFHDAVPEAERPPEVAELMDQEELDEVLARSPLSDQNRGEQ